MDDEKLYHILYADNLRFDSLAAQLFGRIKENLVEEEQFEDITASKTGIDLKLAQHEQNSSQNKMATQSIRYVFKDSIYFDILEELGINPNQPEEFSPDIVDGEIHVLSGTMNISGSSVITPITEIMQATLSQMKKTPLLFGMNNNKNFREELNNIKGMVDILPKIPIPTIFRLKLDSSDVLISGPIREESSRLNMGNMMLLFKGRLPFKWLVIGYLYPAQSHNTEIMPNDFFSYLEKSMNDLGNLFLPQSNAIMFPLLIMR